MSKKYISFDYKDELIDSIKETKSMRAAALYFNSKYVKINSKTFKKMAVELGIWDTNQSGREINKDSHKKYPIEKIFNNELYLQSNKLRKRLINEGYKEKKCEVCGLVSWMDKDIPLELHHKDGNKKNNNLDNLMIICPNCHTFTDTYKSKNKISK